MRIAGFVKNSFVDYPGSIAAVVFVPGCNMDCWYCHNKQLWQSDNIIDNEQIEDFLEKRRGFIDGVVISGGEPTLQSDLGQFIKRVKDMGYRVKLDTNGLKPDVVAKLLPDIDYIALDIKAPPGELLRVVSFDLDESKIWKSADMLMGSDIDYEFRTTFMPMLEVEDIVSIARRIRGARKYTLQQYRKIDNMVTPLPHGADKIKQAAKAAGEYVENVVIRGI